MMAPRGAQGQPCKRPSCQLNQQLRLFKATGEKPTWSPLQSQYIDHPGMLTKYPPNQHNGTSSKLLPWVIPSKAIAEHQPETWVAERPHGELWGPEQIKCTSTPPLKFYILEEAMLPNCPSFNSGEELVKLQGRNGRSLGGLHVAELFFYWQLVNHTWRTYDPMEAQIVVVPAFLNLLSYNEGYCGSMEAGLNHISRAVLDSPRYRVNEGRDFLMLTTGFSPQNILFASNTPARKLFQETTKNFIYASRLNGKFIRLRYVQRRSRCVISVPHTNVNAVAKCTGNDKDGLQCEDANGEETFEEFMANRDYNMFLMGQVRDPHCRSITLAGSPVTPVSQGMMLMYSWLFLLQSLGLSLPGGSSPPPPPLCPLSLPALLSFIVITPVVAHAWLLSPGACAHTRNSFISAHIFIFGMQCILALQLHMAALAT